MYKSSNGGRHPWYLGGSLEQRGGTGEDAAVNCSLDRKGPRKSGGGGGSMTRAGDTFFLEFRAQRGCLGRVAGGAIFQWEDSSGEKVPAVAQPSYRCTPLFERWTT